MAEAIALGLASATLVARVQDLTSRVLRTWSERWGLPVTVEAVEPDPGAALGGADGEWLFERMPSGSIAPAATLWWPRGLEAGLSRALFGAPAGPRAADDSLASRSVRHLCDELRQLLGQAWRVEGWHSDGGSAGGLPVATAARWHAPIDVRVTVAGATLAARVPALRLRPTAPPAPAAPLTRAQTLAAFAPLKARATAVIGQAEISVAELANVQPGDVLLLDASLAEPLHVEIDGVPSPLRADLGVVGAQRAVQLISQPRS